MEKGRSRAEEIKPRKEKKISEREKQASNQPSVYTASSPSTQLCSSCWHHSSPSCCTPLYTSLTQKLESCCDFFGFASFFRVFLFLFPFLFPLLFISLLSTTLAALRCLYIALFDHFPSSPARLPLTSSVGPFHFTLLDIDISNLPTSLQLSSPSSSNSAAPVSILSVIRQAASPLAIDPDVLIDGHLLSQCLRRRQPPPFSIQ